jgi:hypothetical protein
MKKVEDTSMDHSVMGIEWVRHRRRRMALPGGLFAADRSVPGRESGVRFPYSTGVKVN